MRVFPKFKKIKYRILSILILLTYQFTGNADAYGAPFLTQDEGINIAPVATLGVKKVVKADIAINVGDGYTLSDIQGKDALLKAKVLPYGIDLKTQYIKKQKTIPENRAFKGVKPVTSVEYPTKWGWGYIDGVYQQGWIPVTSGWVCNPGADKNTGSLYNTLPSKNYGNLDSPGAQPGYYDPYTDENVYFWDTTPNNAIGETRKSGKLLFVDADANVYMSYKEYKCTGSKSIDVYNYSGGYYGEDGYEPITPTTLLESYEYPLYQQIDNGIIVFKQSTDTLVKVSSEQKNFINIYGNPTFFDNYNVGYVVSGTTIYRYNFRNDTQLSPIYLDITTDAGYYLTLNHYRIMGAANGYLFILMERVYRKKLGGSSQDESYVTYYIKYPLSQETFNLLDEAQGIKLAQEYTYGSYYGQTTWDKFGDFAFAGDGSLAISAYKANSEADNYISASRTGQTMYYPNFGGSFNKFTFNVAGANGTAYVVQMNTNNDSDNFYFVSRYAYRNGSIIGTTITDDGYTYTVPREFTMPNVGYGYPPNYVYGLTAPDGKIYLYKSSWMYKQGRYYDGVMQPAQYGYFDSAAVGSAIMDFVNAPEEYSKALSIYKDALKFPVQALAKNRLVNMSMDTVTDAVSYRANSITFFGHVSNRQQTPFREGTERQNLLSFLADKPTAFAALGNSSNSSQLNSFIADTGNRGIFIDNTDMDQAIQDLADYIVQKCAEYHEVGQNILYDDQLIWDISYSDTENDSKNAQRWRINLDPSYYDNSMGAHPYNGVYLYSPPSAIGKTGQAAVVYSAQDNPLNNGSFTNYWLWSNENLSKLILNSGRIPVAEFNYTAIKDDTYCYPTFYNLSYDPDHSISRADKGIKASKWRWREEGTYAWTSGYPTRMAIGKLYEIRLEVQDIEGYWSNPYTRTIDTTKNPPTVDANPQSSGWINYDLAVNIYASDVDGDLKEIRYAWSESTNKPTSGWTAEESDSIDIILDREGVWYLHMEAWDMEGFSFYRYRGPYMIDKTPPVISLNPEVPGEYLDELKVRVNISDGLSGVKESRFLWSRSPDRPDSGWQSETRTSFDTLINEEGVWYLHVEAWDNAGNSTYVCCGGYTIVIVELFDFTVTLIQDTAWRDYYFESVDANGDGKADAYRARNSTDIKTGRMPINYELNGYKPVSYRVNSVKAGSKVKFYIRAKGSPETVVMKPLYIMEDSGGRTFTENILPVNSSRDFWYFEWIIPFETKQDSFICFDVSAHKDGIDYGNDYWTDKWQAGNNSNIVFYVNGSVLNDLEYNQSH